MKKRMLVGAAGLALAGVAIAADGIRPAPIDSATFLRMRDAALGTSGSAARADVLRQLRHEIEMGNVDPRTVLFTITEDLIPGSGNAPANLNLSNGTEAAGGAPVFGVDAFGGFPPANYTAAPGSNVSLNGQANIFGINVTADPWLGAATDAIMAANTSGPGGSVLTGNTPVPHILPNGSTQFEPYAALARRTGADALTTAFALAMNFRFPLLSPGGTAAEHTRVSTDWYIIDPDTNQWYSPVSFIEGFVSDRMFFGGTQIGGSLGFAEDASGVLTNFVDLGSLPGNFQIGQFYAPPRNATVFPFPVSEWFQVQYVMVATAGGGFGQGMYIKTPATVAANVQDPNMISGAIIPTDKDPVGWLNIYPGVVDDPATVGIVEGIGLSLTQFGVTAPNTGALGMGPLLAAATLSGVQFGEGLDPPANVVAGFQWDDAFVDNFTAAGTLAALPSLLPDFVHPYSEDMESYFPGASIRFQTNRLFDANSSNAVVFTGIAAFGQSLANQNLNSDGLFRQEDNTTVPLTPVRARGKTGAPAIVDVKMFNIPTSATPTQSFSGRAIRVSDGLETGGLTSVIIGGLDPGVGVDGDIWVRQPNTPTVAALSGGTAFDSTQDADDNLRQPNVIPATQVTTALPGTPNFTFDNVDTGVAAVFNAVTTLHMEFEPNPAQDDNFFLDEGLVAITVDGTPLVGPQPGGKWVAAGTSVTTIQVWSGNQLSGNAEVFAVDDFALSGGAFFIGTGGDPFVTPVHGGASFVESFDLYDPGYVIGNAGTTPFRALGSMPDQPVNDSARQLTLKDGASALSAGDLICRYTVDTVALADALGLNVQVGDTFAVRFDNLPPVFNTFVASNLDCPGRGPTPPPDPVTPPGAAQPTDFVVRSAIAVDPVTGSVLTENTARLAEGTWKLQNFTNAPIAFDPVLHATDRQDLNYSFYTTPRWTGAAGTQTIVRVDPTVGPLGSPGVAGNQVLDVNSVDVDGTQTDFVMFGVVSSILPDAIAPVPGTANGDPVITVDETVQLYIESLDAAGAPINAAPRSRMEIAVTGATADGGRIVNIMMGGPNVNNRTGLQFDPNGNPIPGAPPTSGPGGTEPDDRVWVTRASAVANPDFEYLPTPITLLGGGTGTDGSLTGPLVNKWIGVRTRIHNDDTWEVAIDEGAGFVTIATGTALDAGNAGQGAGVVNTNGTGSFNVNIGNDFGSGGTPIPNPFRIHSRFDSTVAGLNEDLDVDGNLDLGVEDIDGDSNFDSVNEDTNGNFILDPGEDLDGDGNLDIGEDVNANGILDPGEDLDGDAVLDLTEDLDSDVNFDTTNEDLNANGVLDTNINGGESFTAVGPAGLDPNADYCFYETTIRDSEAPLFDDKGLVYDVDPVTGVITQDFGANPRPLTQNNDTIAVINRPIDAGPDTIAGTADDFVVPGSALIHDPCPINVSIPINQLQLFKGDGTATLSFAGRWLLDGQAGQAGVNNPNPPGGVNRPSGPRLSLLSYNDASVVPPNFPGGPRRLGMMLCDWGDGVTPGDTGVDTVGTAFPPQRWFFDDVTIALVTASVACPEDLNNDGTVDGGDISFILNSFGQSAVGQENLDLNGDGVVNGGDISNLLNVFGPCP